MKTQIIQLNKNDDYISTRDKMNWCKTGRILLVLPNRGQFLHSKLELNLINRHATSLGAQLAFVTRDAETRYYARMLGIPIFTSLRRAQFSHWQTRNNPSLILRKSMPAAEIENIKAATQTLPQKWLVHPITRVLSFIIGVLAVFALVIVIIPTATVTVTPKEEVQSMEFAVIANPKLAVVNLSTGELPVENRYVVVEGTETITATGEVNVPDQPAFGGLQFTNISDKAINIPVGTIVSTLGKNPVRYITSPNEPVRIETGKSAVVGARAIVPGTTGNLPPDSLVAIESELGLEAVATNPYSTHGGTDAAVPAPTLQDLRRLQDKLTDKLKQDALEALQANLSRGDVLIYPSIRLDETLDKTSSIAAGEPGREVTLSLHLRYIAQTVTRDNLENMVVPILEANRPDGYLPIKDSLAISNLSSPTFGEDGNAHWNIEARRSLLPQIPVAQTLNQIRGKSITRAQDILDQVLPLAGKAQIKLTPGWWPRVPFLPMRIQFMPAET